MVLVRVAVISCLYVLCASPIFADDFRLTVGPAIASNTPQAKTASFVIRTEGCPDASHASVSATAEAVVDGVRKSVSFPLVALPTPDVYAVYRGWRGDAPGRFWVVHLSAQCQRMIASALIPLGPSGFLREPSQFFSRQVTGAEIDSLLASVTANRGVK
jgi:hypothetical protein